VAGVRVVSVVDRDGNHEYARVTFSEDVAGAPPADALIVGGRPSIGAARVSGSVVDFDFGPWDPVSSGQAWHWDDASWASPAIVDGSGFVA
jgi:hypothetical protein